MLRCVPAAERKHQNLIMELCNMRAETAQLAVEWVRISTNMSGDSLMLFRRWTLGAIRR